MNLIATPGYGYSFLEGIYPYSSGVIADQGFEVVHVTLSSWLPWREGIQQARQFVESGGGSVEHLCGFELRCPEPHSMGGFIEFNEQYRQLLEQWGLIIDGQNPIARTNVAPVQQAPEETMLHAFSFVRSSDMNQRTLIVAGGGELIGPLAMENIIRPGDVSPDALREKALVVMNLMLQRLRALGGVPADLTIIDVYTAHDAPSLIAEAVSPQLAESSAEVVWFNTRPPIVDIEFEMDMRAAIELTL
ncbi:MAG: hypothetical protein CMJ76_11665 [Planctomycetaceae bacterium]|nr:hypothetical protein [Planctomycetaceae bacterium]|tara:strand:- start:55 stop:795 length:741 start_codon:yes stop_codon:yes gene_type:complete